MIKILYAFAWEKAITYFHKVFIFKNQIIHIFCAIPQHSVGKTQILHGKKRILHTGEG